MTPIAHRDYLTRYRWAGSVEYLRKTYEQETFDRRYRSGARALAAPLIEMSPVLISLPAKRSGGLGSA
jgi:hypothetical protein